MRNIFYICLSLFLFTSSSWGQDHPNSQKRGTGAGYGTRDATVLSMMGWGIALAVGIGVLCGTLGESSGNGGHSH